MKMIFVQLGKQSGDAALNEDGRRYVIRVARYFRDIRPCFVFAWPFSGPTLEAAKIIGQEIDIDAQNIKAVTPAELRSCKMVAVVIQEDRVPPVLDILVMEFGQKKIYLPPGEGFVGDGYILDFADLPLKHERLPLY